MNWLLKHIVLTGVGGHRPGDQDTKRPGDLVIRRRLYYCIYWPLVVLHVSHSLKKQKGFSTVLG